MANATISITACDNELYLLAIPAASSPGSSYELLHLQSGNLESVNMTVTVSPGAYSQQPTINGVNQAIGQTSSYTVSIPGGDYNLVVIGINWGGWQQFAINLNGTDYSLPQSQPSYASPMVVWAPPTIPAISFNVS